MSKSPNDPSILRRCLGWVWRVQVPSEKVLGSLGIYIYIYICGIHGVSGYGIDRSHSSTRTCFRLLRPWPLLALGTTSRTKDTQNKQTQTLHGTVGVGWGSMGRQSYGSRVWDKWRTPASYTHNTPLLVSVFVSPSCAPFLAPGSFTLDS